MPDRTSLTSTLWLTSPLMLLALVLFASIQTSGFVTGSPRSGSLNRDIVLPQDRPTLGFSAARATDAVLEVNALPSENEEQDRPDALDEPRITFRIPRSFGKTPDRQLIAPRSIPSHYPLRC